MIQRGHIVQPVDLAISESKGTPTIDIIDGRYRHAEYRGMRDVPRLSDAEIRELQDMHNVNNCDECDDWLDAYCDDGMVDMCEEEFFNTYGE